VPFGDDPASTQLLAVAGYPHAGEQTVKAARVRESVMATGSDIFGQEQARRHVIVLAGDVIPGDSGGPLLSREGSIVGIVFASALSGEGHTGYALTASEAAIALSREMSQTVSTGVCPPD
jgi:S1-C subfamily serine protease